MAKSAVIEKIERETKKDERSVEKENRKRQKLSKRLVSEKTLSSQSLLGDLLGIEPDGQLILSGHRRCQILEIDFTNFDWHMDEQKSILLELLHKKVILQLPYTIQILRVSVPTKVNDLVETMKDQAKLNSEELYRNIGKSIAGHVREVALRSFIQDVRYFVVVPYSLAESETAESGGFIQKLPMGSSLSGLGSAFGVITKPVGEYFGFGSTKEAKVADIHKLKENLSQRVTSLTQGFTSAQLKVLKLGPLATLEVIASIINSERDENDVITVEDLFTLMPSVVREGTSVIEDMDYTLDDIDPESASERAVELFGTTDLAAGLRTVPDLLAPERVEIGEKYIYVDGVYQSTLISYKLPHEIDPNALNVLNTVNMPNVVSIFVHPISNDHMTSVLDYQAGGYLSSINQAAKFGGIPDHTQSLALEHNQRLRDEIGRGLEMCARISIYFKVSAHSKAELDDYVTHYINTMQNAGFRKVRPAHLRHDLGFKTVLPLAQDYLGVSRMTDGRTIARVMIGSRERLCHRSGFFVGRATTGPGNIMMLNLKSRELRNGHLFACGASGAGKSVVTKYFITQARVLTKSKIFVLDPDCEYGPVIELLNGRQVIISPQSEDAINILDFASLKKAKRKSLQKKKKRLDDEDKDPLSWHISMLKNGEALPRLVGNGPLTSTQLSLLDTALYETYKRAEITRDIATHTKAAPLLSDLQSVLSDFADPSYQYEGTRVSRRGWAELAEEMSNNLEQYTQGAYSSLFNRPTNIDFSNRLIAFGISDISPNSPLAPVAYWMLTMCIWSSAKMMDEESIIMVDEASHIMRVAGGANLILDIAQRGRKKNVSLWLCTQHPYSLLMHQQGETIMANITTRIMLGQEDSGATALRDRAGLNEYEVNYLLSCGGEGMEGEGILQVKRDRSFIKIIVPPQLLQVLNTDPRLIEEDEEDFPQLEENPEIARLLASVYE